MQTHFMAPSASLLRRARQEPPVARPVVRRQTIGNGVLKALLLVGAAALAVSTIIVVRIMLTAHQVPDLQEELARFLPFLD
jgi:hypothetical protein